MTVETKKAILDILGNVQSSGLAFVYQKDLKEPEYPILRALNEISDLVDKDVHPDIKRLDWVLPILSLADGPTDLRALKLGATLVLGKTGRDALDEAMASIGSDIRLE